MMRNVPLLEATMQKIVDNPELHDQSYYFTRNECGTAACFAGWACMLAGYRPVEQFNSAEWDKVRAPGTWETEYAATVARELLGLSNQERLTLFAGANTTAMLQLMVKDLVNGDEMKSVQDYREEAEQDD